MGRGALLLKPKNPTGMTTQSQSKLATVMSQLFPMFVGGTLNLKEIIANKLLISDALMGFATKNKSFILSIEDGKLIRNKSGLPQFTLGSWEQNWQWLSENFLSLTFVKEEGLHFPEHPIQRVIVIASAITKLYSRLRTESSVSEEDQDMIHSLKYKFEERGSSGKAGSTFNIGLDEIFTMQRLLREYKEKNSLNEVIVKKESSQYWIVESIKRINLNVDVCLQYVSTLV